MLELGLEYLLVATSIYALFWACAEIWYILRSCKCVRSFGVLREELITELSYYGCFDYTTVQQEVVVLVGVTRM